jgi:hypothetical protein
LFSSPNSPTCHVLPQLQFLCHACFHFLSCFNVSAATTTSHLFLTLNAFPKLQTSKSSSYSLFAQNFSRYFLILIFVPRSYFPDKFLSSFFPPLYFNFLSVSLTLPSVSFLHLLHTFTSLTFHILTIRLLSNESVFSA